MEVRVKLEREEIIRDFPYQMVTESYSGRLMKSGSVQRKYKHCFNEQERELIRKNIIPKAHKWTLVSGVPDYVDMSMEEYKTWQKLFEFLRTVK